MKHDRVLRCALLGNALFSLVTGLSMAVAPALLGEILGTSPAVLQMVGIALLLFAGWLAYLGRCRSIAGKWVILASVNDFAWVVGTAVLLVGWPGVFNATGRATAVGVAVIVGAFGVAQLCGLAVSARDARDREGEILEQS
jgi:hypothetical protein